MQDTATEAKLKHDIDSISKEIDERIRQERGRYKVGLYASQHRSSNIQLTITKSNCALVMSGHSGVVIPIRLIPKALADVAEEISLTAFLNHMIRLSTLLHTTLQQQA